MTNFYREMERIVSFLHFRLKKDIRPVGLHDMPSIMPRKGIIGDWKNHFSREDEKIFQAEVVQQGLDWNSFIWPDEKFVIHPNILGT